MDWSTVYKSQGDSLESMLARNQAQNSAMMQVAQELQRRKEAERSFGLQEENARENRALRTAQQESLDKDRTERTSDRKEDNARLDKSTAAATLAKFIASKRKGDVVTPVDQVDLVQGGHTGFATGAGGDEHMADPHFHVAANTALDAADAKEVDTDARQSELDRHNKEMERAAMISATKPTGGAGNPGGLTPNQSAQLTTKLRADYNKVSTGARTMKQQQAIMNSALAEADKGNMNAATQAVISTFNKILDPNSVVRESEYDRSPAGMALLDRIKGFGPKLANGGIGMTPEALREFAGLAQEWTKNAEVSVGALTRPILAQADHYGVDRSFIADNGGAAADPGVVSATPSAPPAAAAKPDLNSLRTKYKY